MDAIAAGADVATALERVAQQLRAAGFGPVDYVELRHAASLQPLATCPPGTPARVLAAAWLGDVRLIDGMAMPTVAG